MKQTLFVCGFKGTPEDCEPAEKTLQTSGRKMLPILEIEKCEWKCSERKNPSFLVDVNKNAQWNQMELQPQTHIVLLLFKLLEVINVIDLDSLSGISI